MKTLRIIVPKDSAVDSFLAEAGFMYDTIARLYDRTSYNMSISKSLQLIDLLVSKFGLKDFSVWCDDGHVTFLVCS